MDEPGKVADLARGQLNMENNIPLSPRVPENSISRETGAAVPSRVSLLISILRVVALVLVVVSNTSPNSSHFFVDGGKTDSASLLRLTEFASATGCFFRFKEFYEVYI